MAPQVCTCASSRYGILCDGEEMTTFRASEVPEEEKNEASRILKW